MKEAFIFEFLKLVATILITYLISRPFVDSVFNEHPDLLSMLVLILGFLIYYFVKFLMDILRPITIKVNQNNHDNPNPEETHIVVESYENNNSNKESPIIIEIKIKYLSQFSKPIILFLFNRCKLYLQFQTASKKVFLRSNNYHVFSVDKKVSNGVNFNISDSVINIIKISDNNSTNGEKYKLYIRTKSLEEAKSIESNIKVNLITEENMRRRDYFYKFILINFIKKSFSTHKIYYYKKGV